MGVDRETAGAVDLADLAGSRPSSALVARLTVTGSTGQTTSEWLSGPLPIVQPANETTRARGNLPTTSEDARRTLVASQQADALYGAAKLERRHRLLSPPLALGALEVHALEVLSGTPLSAFPDEQLAQLVVHVSGPDLPAYLDELARPNEVWAGVHELLPSGLAVTPHARARAVHYAEGDTLLTAYALASRARPGQLPDLEARAAAHDWTIRKVDWSALVLRDGAAFLSHQQSSEAFGPSLRVLVHSVYVDAMLLALLQRQLLDASGGRAVVAPLDSPEQLVELERAHFDFKRTYWRTSLTSKRTAPPDEVLRALQRELLTERDVAEVEERVRDGARLAQSLHARNQELAQRHLNEVVQTGTVVIGSFALAFTAVQVLREPGAASFLLAMTMGVLGTALTFLLLHLLGTRPRGH